MRRRSRPPKSQEGRRVRLHRLRLESPSPSTPCVRPPSTPLPPAADRPRRLSGRRRPRCRHRQVNNRDMSIAVLRTFISRLKEEHAAFLSKKLMVETKASEEKSSKPEEHTTPEEEETANGVMDMLPSDEPVCLKKPSNGTAGVCSREQKPPRILEALAASGLRSLRYAREVEGIGQVVALDNDKVSVEACKKNIQFNGSLASSKVEAHLADARVYMLMHPKEYDVVDLDPYGSPAVFLDSAVQSVADGGILMCTATDMAVLCGGNGEVCYAKYGSYPLKGKYCHEMALRILLASIESHANRYKRYIVPILSVQMDFYIQVFVRIYTMLFDYIDFLRQRLIKQSVQRVLRIIKVVS